MSKVDVRVGPAEQGLGDTKTGVYWFPISGGAQMALDVVGKVDYEPSCVGKYRGSLRLLNAGT